MALTTQMITERLSRVAVPGLGGDLLSLNLVENVAVCEGAVNVRVALPAAAAEHQATVQSRIEAAINALDEPIDRVTVDFASAPATQAESAGPPEHQAPAEHPSPQQAARTDNPLPNVRHIIAVGAGKGGVGKSTVAVALAVGLARRGAQVGLLDGDIYGPSTPTLLGLEHEQPMGTKDILFPFSVHGIKTITIGKLVDPDKPLIWRGPMAHSAFRQLATQTDWGELDYLIVDLPPGTGDVPLTMAQLLPLRGAIIVCTPQKVARDDARRAVRMFEQLDVPVLGVVENMSYFVADDGKEYDIFGRGGAEAMAQEMGLALLGSIPIHMELRQAGDMGEPLRNFEGNEQLAGELNQFVENVALKAEQDAAAESGGRPTLSIS